MSESRNRPWSREEFMSAVDGMRVPGLKVAHEKLLAQLESLPFVETVFDGRGATTPSYNVRRTGIRDTLLRVRENGRVQACIGAFVAAGLHDLAACYRRRVAHLVKRGSGDWPFLIKSLPAVAPEEIIRALRAVAAEGGWGEDDAHRDVAQRPVPVLVENQSDAAAQRPLVAPSVSLYPPAMQREVFSGYELLERICAGGMAESFKARKLVSGRIVFLKRVRTSSRDRLAIERELQVYSRLTRLENPHVLPILDVFRDDEFVGLVSEFATEGDLEGYVRLSEPGGLNWPKARAVAVEVATALVALHSHDIVHRDLKPANVLRFHEHWKLADFGISKNLSRLITNQTHQQAGTHGYAAPEQLQGIAAHPSADIYSFGKVLVYLLTGQTDVDHVRHAGWLELIHRCIQRDPEQRPSAALTLVALRDLKA